MMDGVTMNNVLKTKYQSFEEGTAVVVNANAAHQQPLQRGATSLPVAATTPSNGQQRDDIVSIPKEILLISMVSQEQELYNPKHEFYRNTLRKDQRWKEIANGVGWTETQCKAKWKAMRDQYCRELKRTKMNVKATVKWKYFKDLEFLRPYALSRNYRPRSTATLKTSNNGMSAKVINAMAGGCSAASIASSKDDKYHIKLEMEQFDPFISVFTTSVAEITNSCVGQSVDMKGGSTGGNRLADATLTNGHLATMADQHHHQQQHQHNDRHHQQQQQQLSGNWSYLQTVTTASQSNETTATMTTAPLPPSHHLPDDGCNYLQESGVQSQMSSDHILNSTFVDCLAEATMEMEQQQHQTQSQQQPPPPPHSSIDAADDDADDSIHTFLNIESFFEKELIALIQSEEILYNTFQANYRNTKMKQEVWERIARKLKKTVKQCRLKWKALRDQYIREHKRLRSCENADSLPRWKHYDALSFLQKYIKGRLKWNAKCRQPEDHHNVSEDLSKELLHPLGGTLEVDLHDHRTLAGPTTFAGAPTAVATTMSISNRADHENMAGVKEETNFTAGSPTVVCVVSSEPAARTMSVHHHRAMDINSYIISSGHTMRTINTGTHSAVGMITDGDGDGGGNNDDGNDDGDGGCDDDEDDDDEEDEDGDDRMHCKTMMSSSSVGTMSSSVVFTSAGDFDRQLAGENNLLIKHLQQKEQQDQQQQQQQQQQHHPPPQPKSPQLASDDDFTLGSNCPSSEESLQYAHEGEFQSSFMLKVDDADKDFNLDSHHHYVTDDAMSVHVAEVKMSPAKESPAAVTVAAATAASATTTVSSNAASGTVDQDLDNDEFGTFFKALAMKIRNAKMSPVAFTDLQIDILRVINNNLRQ